MIPQRVLLRGFLCYTEEQEVCFDGSSLWLLAGLNGSGKSAVFDAITYALFGSHRAGTLHAQELINKDSDDLMVEFHFTLGSNLYRIRRTLRRSGRPTQQIYQHGPGKDGPLGKWETVTGTGTRDGFQNWVRDNIGLTHDTFTSSVLLRQGQAEKLLDSQPRDRFKVLASIVDLGRYQGLHERADVKRRHFKDRAESLQNQLEGLAEVTELELTAAALRTEAAQGGLEQAQTQVDRLQRLHVQAEGWARLQTKLLGARQQWQQAQSLLTDAETIERDANRLRELREVLPHVRTAMDQRDRLANSAALTEQLKTERQELDSQWQQLKHALEQNQQKQELFRKDIANDQQRTQELSATLSELQVLLERIDQCEKQRREKAQIVAELAKLPLDPTSKVEREQQECHRLLAIKQALPHLTQLLERRNDYQQACERARAATEKDRVDLAHGLDLKAKADALTPQVEAATKARQQAEAEATAARTRWEEAGKQVRQLSELDGTKRCRYCGQELSPEHVELERKSREKIRGEVEGAFQVADQVRKTAVDEEKRLLERKKELDEKLSEARDQLREARGQKARAEQDTVRYLADCNRIYLELAEPFRARVAAGPPQDWLTITYPAAADIQDGQRQVQGLPAADKRLKQLRDTCDSWKQLRAKHDIFEQTLNALQAGLPKDLTVPRQQHDKARAEENSLRERLKTQRVKLTEAEKEAERLGRLREGVQEQLAGKDQKMQAEEVRREACLEALARTRAALPATWQHGLDTATPADGKQWQEELDGLTRRQAEERGQALRQARDGLEPLRLRLAELERELDEIPSEARCEPAVVQKQVATAKAEQTDRETELRLAQSARERLVDRATQRQQLQQEHLEMDRLSTRHRVLAELLGPKRLQLHLLRQAERGIVQYANGVLDRISGGQLYLRLRGEEPGETNADQALQLEAYNRNTGQTAIDVSFLSGSQRFRVAVSLALGIGQYASRQHRPIESVIIDEGFGCLDRQGRQVMIEELRALRGELRCILLVSHQEEFAEAFADGYHFELNNGSTRVRRFQR